MSSNKTRTISALLLLGLILSGCGDTNANVDNPGSTADSITADNSTDTELTPDLPDVNYGGYTFTIAYRDQSGMDWAGDIATYDEQAGDVVNDQKYNRNLSVENKLGIKIETYILSGDSTGSSATASILAGDQDYDLIAPHAHIAWSNYIGAGLALDWSNLTYCNFDMPWWDQGSRETLSVNGKIYSIAGDFSYYSLAYTRALIFNKDILTDLNEDMPYTKVFDGTWTFDEFNRLSILATGDLNGDTEYNVDDDQYGYLTNWWGGNIAFLYAGGSSTTKKNEDDIPYFTLGDERSVNIYEKFFKMMENEGSQVLLGSSTEAYYNAFHEGRLLFTDVSLFDTQKFRDMKHEWGILPLPKYDEEQENYYSPVDAGVHLYIVPVNTENPERTSVILEEMAYEGYKTVIPAFYETALKGKYARDDESIQILELIKGSRVFDFGYFTCYQDELHHIGCAGRYLVQETDPNLSSYCATYLPAAEAALSEMIDTILESNETN